MLKLFFPRSHRQLTAARNAFLYFSPQVSRTLMLQLQFETEALLVPEDSGSFCNIPRVGDALRVPKTLLRPKHRGRGRKYEK